MLFCWDKIKKITPTMHCFDAKNCINVALSVPKCYYLKVFSQIDASFYSHIQWERYHIWRQKKLGLNLSGQTLFKDTWNLKTKSKPNLDSSLKIDTKKHPNMHVCVSFVSQCSLEKTNSMFLKCESWLLAFFSSLGWSKINAYMYIHMKSNSLLQFWQLKVRIK